MKHPQIKKDLTVLRHQKLPLAPLPHPVAQTMTGDSLGYTAVCRSSWMMEDTADCSQGKALHGITAGMHRRESARGGGGERKLWKLFGGIASAEYFYIFLSFETSNIFLHICSMFPKLGGPESQPWKREICLEQKLAVMKVMPRKCTRISLKKANVSSLWGRRDGFAFTQTRSPSAGASSRGIRWRGNQRDCSRGTCVWLGGCLPLFDTTTPIIWHTRGYREPFPTDKMGIHLSGRNHVQTLTPV